MVHRLPFLTAFAFSLGVSVAVLASGCAPSPGVVAGNAPGASQPVPTTALLTADGAPTNLGTFLHGRTALVSFWATWCDACVEEMPALNRLTDTLAGRDDALVLGVAVGEARDTVAAFARTHRQKYALLVDEDFHFADALGERRVPTTLVVDSKSRIVYRGGALDEAGLDAFRRAAAPR
jgi:peroxiredoxin